MKLTSLTTLAAAGLLSATPALAGSLDDPIEPPEPAKPVADPAPTGPDWTGFYAAARWATPTRLNPRLFLLTNSTG